ncbi:aspartate aminotransferase family protein [uncultured Eubacterium sp.]|uniref:aspartate aminotransferase family protein n=1 Tax=uncultured Eubacterium sp. TaxID=165185 RepID=UPI002672949F|nr:aspartate aminotransferase family protein [uncultured Eubacterium sp.]
MTEKEYMDLGEQYFIHTYNRFPVVIEKGEDVYVYDVTGKKYLDFAAGIAVSALGYSNDAYKEALKQQVDKILHTSNLYYNVPSIEAAEKLVKKAGLKKAFFTNSGAEAIEGALKMAKRYAYDKNGADEYEIIAMKHSFHGRTMGALALTGNAHYQEPFGPMIPGIKYAEFNNLDSVKALVSEKTCAIILEPVQGEGGIYPAEKEFMEGIRNICDENDILMICDEIQCGMGRTGKMFAFEHYNVVPDIITCAKALGCGVPVGAFVAGEKCCDSLVPGDHGTTYGGNPLATAAVSKVFDLFEENNILAHVSQISGYFEEQLERLVEDFDNVLERRGKGLMQGLVLTSPVADVVNGAMEKGLLVISAGNNVLRMVPPLIITREHVDEMIEILRTVLGK